MNESDSSYCVCVEDVVNAVKHLKSGKSSGEEGLNSDHLVLDWIILIKEQKSLCTSNLQFGFKEGVSTTQCTYVVNETISYYNFHKSNVHV